MNNITDNCDNLIKRQNNEKCKVYFIDGFKIYKYIYLQND